MIMVLIGFICIGLLDLIPLIRRKKWQEITAFSILFAVSLTFAVLYSINVKVPSLMLFLGNIMKSIGIAYS